nr:glycosyltransferase family 4 protein [Nocardioides sp. zg-DK7169]
MAGEQVARFGNVVEFGRVVERAPRPDVNVLGFVGKLGPVKRPHLILEAIRNQIDSGANVRGLFVGPFATPEYRRYFEQLVARLGLEEAVELTGFVADPRDHIASMDLFILPSASEGLPGAMVEAMAAGVPCIVTDVGAMGDVVRTSGGGSVIEPSSDGIAACVDGYRANPDALTKASSSARAFAAQNFSAEQVAREYIQLIHAHQSELRTR